MKSAAPRRLQVLDDRVQVLSVLRPGLHALLGVTVKMALLVLSNALPLLVLFQLPPVLLLPLPLFLLNHQILTIICIFRYSWFRRFCYMTLCF